MNALTAPFRQLVDRKLWPLAILLIAALAAVPMLLAKDDVSLPPVPGATGVASVAQSPTQPIVSLGEPAERESRRKVLGARKNPFEPTVKAKKATDKSTTTAIPNATGGAPAGGDTKTAGDKPAAGGGGAAPAPVTAGPAPVVAPVAPKKTYELFSLRIRFGSTDAPRLARRSIKRLTALPRMDEPTLVYLGLKKDLKTAVFLVDANTTVVGDGKCLPQPHDCQTLELKKGQTAFIDVLDDAGNMTSQYELDLVSIIRSKTSDAEAAKAARTAVAKGGRKALRAKVSRVGGWDFDPETGVLVEPGE